jgi:hypothetical protein
MKMNLGWLGFAPGIAMSILVNSTQLQGAEDPPGSVKTKGLVIVRKGSDTADIIAKVTEELNKADIADKIKVDIIEKLKALTSESEPSPENGEKEKDSKKSAKKIILENSNADGRSLEEVKVTVIAGDAQDQAEQALSKLPLLNGLLRSTIVRPLGKEGDRFRIGVACRQLSDTQDDEKASADQERDRADKKTEDQKPGLRIESVLEDSPAADAGIQKGDVLVTVDSKEIKVVADLTEVIQEAGKKDKDVTLDLVRDDKMITVHVKPSKLKASDIEMESIQLNLPARGFLLNEEAMKKWQEQASKLKEGNAASSAFAFAMPDGNGDWKKEVDELKSEIADLKKLVRELIDKK